jgi:hypothetical protein
MPEGYRVIKAHDPEFPEPWTVRKGERLRLGMARPCPTRCAIPGPAWDGDVSRQARARLPSSDT